MFTKSHVYLLQFGILFSQASTSPHSGQLSVKWAFPKGNNKTTNECDVKAQSERVSHTADKRAKK